MITIIEQKQLLRTQIRKQRQGLSADVVEIASNKLCENLLQLCQDKKNIAIYHPCGNEISLMPLVAQLLKNNQKVFRPIAHKTSRQMQFAQIYDTNHYPIFESDSYHSNNLIKDNELDLILLPLLAIDKQGYRLGQGGGYYDNTLVNLHGNVCLCGVGYDWQLLEFVPHEEHDIPLDYFVSDKAVYFLVV